MRLAQNQITYSTTIAMSTPGGHLVCVHGMPTTEDYFTHMKGAHRLERVGAIVVAHANIAAYAAN